MSVEPEQGNSDDFNFDWEALSFSSSSAGSENWLASDDWEERFARDTTGYVSDPLTTSFTDLDLTEAQVTLRKTAEWADFDSWPESSASN